MLPITKNFVIAGLGNLDRSATRHSIGMIIIDRLCAHWDLTWTRNKKIDGLMVQKKFNTSSWSTEIYLLKSCLPMNINGYSVGQAASMWGVPSSQVYLIHDELDMAVGTFGMKDGGSARGHNGVKSVMNSLRCNLMPRLRIGIGRPADVSQVPDYVLKKFTAEEQLVIDKHIDDCLVKLFRHIALRHGVSLELSLALSETSLRVTNVPPVAPSNVSWNNNKRKKSLPTDVLKEINSEISDVYKNMLPEKPS